MKKVKIYALTTCLWCRKTKQFFEERKIPFECVEYDKLEESRQEELMKEIRASGGTGSFPFIRIGGACVQGYDPQEFEQLLKKK